MKALFLFAFTITRRVVFRRHCLLLLLIILSGSSLPRTLLLLLLLPFLSWYLLRLLLPFLFCLLLQVMKSLLFLLKFFISFCLFLLQLSSINLLKDDFMMLNLVRCSLVPATAIGNLPIIGDPLKNIHHHLMFLFPLSLQYFFVHQLCEIYKHIVYSNEI